MSTERASGDGGAKPPTAPTGWWGSVRDQVGLTGLEPLIGGLIRDYMIPKESNSLWYTLGGVLGISLGLELLTGVALLFNYAPDAALAYQSTRDMLNNPIWALILNYHYWNAYLIFGLVMIHMMRVFISGAYGGSKIGLWEVGVALAVLVFALSITGETLHWDERGFAVPWHVGEFLEALGLQGVFNWTHKGLLDIAYATPKLRFIYVLHIVVLPALLLFAVTMHYYLIKLKGISLPFWLKPSGRTGPFSEHIRAWLIYGGIAVAVILVISLFHRDPGPAPQNLPFSTLFHSKGGPGSLGITPTYPISWTHGMNRFVDIVFHLSPDIWGTVIGMFLMLGALVLVPFVDRRRAAPVGWSQAFDLRTRGWAFALIALFWVTMIVGTVTNAVTPVG